MIRTKVSTPPLDIQKSKDTIQILNDYRDGNTNFFSSS
jgi:hypothetical protein